MCVCACESSLVMFLYLKTLSIIVVNDNLFFLIVMKFNLGTEQMEQLVLGGGNKLIVLHSLRHALT